jgi:hypothetical protein
MCRWGPKNSIDFFGIREETTTITGTTTPSVWVWYYLYIIYTHTHILENEAHKKQLVEILYSGFVSYSIRVLVVNDVVRALDHVYDTTVLRYGTAYTTVGVRRNCTGRNQRI